jgi:acylphosphatase
VSGGMIIRRAVFRGRVQGVGFRDFVERQAERIGVEGWVRNRRDESVEAIFAGPSDEVAAMVAACRRGPRSAHVETVDVSDANESELSLRPAGVDFVTLPTV